MLQADYRKITLDFKETAITSRDRMRHKDTYIVKVWHSHAPESVGVGECALFRGLSEEDTPGYEEILAEACRNPEKLPPVSSIRFGFETAIADLQNGGRQCLSQTEFTSGVSAMRINGLIWMGDWRTMARRISEKLDAGFRCIKLKIGGINFEDEIDLLSRIRSRFTTDDVELRLDANGSFSPESALEKLGRLEHFGIHSIEQPIRAGQWELMAEICRQSPIPIALDEELIGFKDDAYKEEMLDNIAPSYIILKPSLCGGFREADRWIESAEKREIGWWATSALESNIGLNAIAQWVAGYNPTMPQGLGTGALYRVNFTSPLRLEGEWMHFDPDMKVESSSLWRMADKKMHESSFK